MGAADVRHYLYFLPDIQCRPYSSVWMTFDKDADVLYINFKKDLEATDSELTDDDVIIRYHEDDIIGFTVLHASKRTLAN